MFTGLIADIGKVEALEAGADGSRIRISTGLAGQASTGDSISVNGCCLTAAVVDEGAFEADVMNQTLRLTSLGPLEPGDQVNLELALRASDRLGGHVVSGHIDGTGTVERVSGDGFATLARIGAEPGILRHVVERGSIAVDGVSLTVATLDADAFEVSLIPETRERTTLGLLEPGRLVNIETDILAKYVERLLADRA